VALGDASYALYVLHVPVILWLFVIGEKVVHRSLLDEPAVVLETMVGVVALSVLVFRGLEAPLRRRLRSILTAAAHAVLRA
jgi:peptidoglycan/LPS O-acetylase OafA/YrhL